MPSLSTIEAAPIAESARPIWAGCPREGGTACPSQRRARVEGGKGDAAAGRTESARPPWSSGE